MTKILRILIFVTAISGSLLPSQSYSMKNYTPTRTLEILSTAENGDISARKENVTFKKGTPGGTVVLVKPEIIKQTIDGIGTSFTESSAFVLAHLDKQKRQEVMETIFGAKGANFSLTRTHIGSCDFSVKGKYSYADVKGDLKLENFSIAQDKDGFKRSEYPGVKDEKYDLLPMIQEAIAIKSRQQDKELRIIASAWTAPAWMKDIEEWYIPGSPKNNWQGTGGSLKTQYVPTYADYLIKYIDAYQAEGIRIWGITPVNEPYGNNGQWESMHFTPEGQNDFIKNQLGPKLHASSHADVKLLTYDHNRDGLEKWTDLLFADPVTAKYLYGAAIHWYESTFRVFEDVLDRVIRKFPKFAIIHTEGCIDDLGKPAPAGILDPVRFQESGWFNNDAFWWNKNATDWGYSATWAGVNAADHPIYTPVHRYARNIIVSLNHAVRGWIDWNIVLDRTGGPNHAGNFCGAPIMIDPSTQQVYYTPIFHVLAQFSKTIRPGDTVVQTDTHLAGLDPDTLHACATLNRTGVLSVQLLNTTKKPIRYSLQIGAQFAEIHIAANSVQTVRVQL
ncbi:MAG: glycoside hydrolase family 30 protein [Desulfuromonadaceae bacterium]